MINIKNTYLISIKLLIFLILLISCSSTEKDSNPLVLKDIQIYKTGLASLQDGNYKKAIIEFDNLSLNHPFSSLAKKSEIMKSYTHYQNKKIKKSINKLKFFIEMNPKDEFSDFLAKDEKG